MFSNGFRFVNRNRILTLIVGPVAVGVAVFTTSFAHAQTTTAPPPNECAECNTLSCTLSNGSPDWLGEEFIWNIVLARPAEIDLTTLKEKKRLAWFEIASLGTFPPMRYHACFGTGTDVECETVEIDAFGVDTNPLDHPSIRFNSGSPEKRVTWPRPEDIIAV